MSDHRHIYLVGDPHCRICFERQDAHDAELVDLRAGRSETHLTSLRAGPVGLEAVPDRPTYYPPGGAA